MAAWVGYAQDILRAGGWPVTPQNVLFIETWHGYEQSPCTNNPLNTTEPWPRSKRCNSVGVRSYATPANGAAATVRTLENGFYFAIVAALASGNPFLVADPETVAAQIRTWGTGNFATWYLQQVGGIVSPPGGTGGGSAPSDASAPFAHSGFRDLRNSLARHLPTQLERSRKTGDLTLRLLASRHRARR